MLHKMVGIANIVYFTFRNRCIASEPTSGNVAFCDNATQENGTNGAYQSFGPSQRDFRFVIP